MLDATQFYPWHMKMARSWLSNRQRFSHAWLIHGIGGIGKTQFALAAGASLLCETPNNGIACGNCQSCKWVKSGNHPDIKRIRPDIIAIQEFGDYAINSDNTADLKKPSNEIRIAQLRSLSNWFNLATHKSGNRVAIIYPANSMNLITANALLKILEEPPTNTIFLLVCDYMDRLLPTIISRCRRLPIPTPDMDICIKWLQQQGVNNAENWLAATSYAPLTAFKLAQTNDNPYPVWVEGILTAIENQSPNPDIADLVDTLEKDKTNNWIQVLQKILFDAQLISNGENARYYPSLIKLKELALNINPTSISSTYKWLLKQNMVSNHPLNAKLFIHNCIAQVILSLQLNN